MNIRFSDHHIRFRVARQELERLMAGRSLSLDVAMPRAHQFRATINVTSLGEWHLDSDPTGLWLSLPRSALEPLLQELPSKEGLKHQFSMSSGTSLSVSFEVDTRSVKFAA